MRHIGAMPEPVILVEQLVKRYGKTVAVDGISFAVERGVTAALLGGNGAGKTTTLSILLGLLLPSSGTVHVFGEDVLRHRYRVLPRMNFSSPYVDLPHRLTVRQNLSIYARLYGLQRREERIGQLARDLQIEAFLDRPAGKASAGPMTSPALRRFGEAAFSPARVWAMLLRYLYILRSSWPRTLELLYWPTLQMLIWGFMSQFLRGNSSYVAQAFGVLLGAVMLWDLLFRSQLGLSISFLEEMWARNLGQLFVTPLRPYEWLISLFAMSLIRGTSGLVPAAQLT